VGFAPLEPRFRWERLWSRKHLLDLSGARFIFSSTESRASELSTLFSDDKVWVYENREALPRAFVVACAAPAGENDAFEAVLRNTTPGLRAVVEDHQGLERCSLESAGQVEIKQESPGNWRLEVEAEQPAWLVFSETYYPGFKWAIDGVDAPYFRTNYLFQGTEVSAGSHQVTISYRPMWLYAAIALSWLFAIGLLGWMLLGRLPGSHRVLLEIPVFKPEDLDDDAG